MKEKKTGRGRGVRSNEEEGNSRSRGGNGTSEINNVMERRGREGNVSHRNVNVILQSCTQC